MTTGKKKKRERALIVGKKIPQGTVISWTVRDLGSMIAFLVGKSYKNNAVFITESHIRVMENSQVCKRTSFTGLWYYSFTNFSRYMSEKKTMYDIIAHEDFLLSFTP